MKKFLVLLTIVTIILSCNSNEKKEADSKEETQNQVFETNEPWAARLASGYFETRKQYDLWMARTADQQGYVSILNSLSESIDSVKYKRMGQERLFFPTNYRPIWKNDKADTLEWNSRLIRIKYVSDSTLKTWTEALEAQGGSDISEIWMIGFLIDVKSLFTNNELSVHRSEQLLSRLKLLPKSASESVDKALNIGNMWAAMLLIQNDDLFESNGNIKQSQLDVAMKLLNEKIQKK